MLTESTTDSKAKLPYRHCYVKQKLYEDGIEIYSGEEQILYPRTKNEMYLREIKKLNTHIKSNVELVEEGEIKHISDYNDLIRMGYMIVSKKPSSRYFQRQGVIYSLKRYNQHVPYIKGIPANHFVEYDVLNERIRLKGRNAGPLGVGNWVYLSATIKKEEKQYLSFIDDHEKIKRKLLSRFTYVEEIPEIIDIAELPVLISNRGEIVCIDTTGDSPVIGFVGSRGRGKTLGMHGVTDRAYWKGITKRIAILNDSLNQIVVWSLPCDYVEHRTDRRTTMFSRDIRKIGEHPMPLPLGFIHPNTHNLMDLVYPGEDISFRMVIPFKHIIENYTYFFKRKKEWELGKSAPYFRNIKDELLRCTNLDEVEEVLIIAVEEEKLNKGSKDKILSVLMDVFNQKILDVNTGIPAYWTVKKGDKELKLNPVLALLEAGAIPVVMTQNLLPKDYFPQYMRYIIDSIFDYQLSVKKHENESTWLLIDEIPDISSTINKTVAAESLRRCVTEGRSPKLATLYTLQNYSQLDPLIRNNTTHLFAFRNKAKQMKEISKDFDLLSHHERDILHLKKFQVIAMTTDKFIVYTPDGIRYTTSESIKGTILMPLSQHQRADKKEED